MADILLIGAYLVLNGGMLALFMANSCGKI